MSRSFSLKIPLHDFSLWDKMRIAKELVTFSLEITARCNNNCRHCYINLPANDNKAKEEELTLSQIENIADQAVSLGALWCLITGGEPLLREDFFDIYLSLKKKGLLVSVFTNATLIRKEHISLFKEYPPRDIEVTVYGVTEETHERVTGTKGTFKAFMRGLELLFENKIRVRFKAMALRSNVDELQKISSFCRARTKDYFRFDPLLHLRFDRDPKRNEEIKSERLSASQIAAIEQADSERAGILRKNCGKFIMKDLLDTECSHLFHCGAGNGSFDVSYDGIFRLCSSLWHPDCVCDLKKTSLYEAYKEFIPKVRDMHSDREEFLGKCKKCRIINLCLWCPAHAYLETGHMDAPVDYFCQVAHSRADSIKKDKP